MPQHDESDDARILAEAIAEILNCFCQMIEPDRFGPPTPSTMASFRSSLRDLRDLLPHFRGRTPPQLDLKALVDVAGQLERRFTEDEMASMDRPLVGELADRFAHAIGLGGGFRGLF